MASYSNILGGLDDFVIFLHSGIHEIALTITQNAVIFQLHVGNWPHPGPSGGSVPLKPAGGTAPRLPSPP